MDAGTDPRIGPTSEAHPLAALDLAASVRYVATVLAGNLVRFTRRGTGEIATVGVAGCTIHTGHLEVLVDWVVADTGDAFPTDIPLPWRELATATVVGDGAVTDDQRAVLAAAIVPALLAPCTTVSFLDGRPSLTARLAGFTTELPDDVTLFFQLDLHHGPHVAGRFAVVRWSEIRTLDHDATGVDHCRDGDAS